MRKNPREIELTMDEGVDAGEKTEGTRVDPFRCLLRRVSESKGTVSACLVE